MLAIEPAGIFFNSILHREPVLVLASGLVVFGGTKIWTKLDLRGVVLLGSGCAIAVATRPYAGWFLITGGLLLILHAALRQMKTRLRSVPLVYAVAIVVVAMTPTVLELTSQDSLENKLQVSQDANTAANTERGAANSNNLALERVDFSTRTRSSDELPRRIRDVVLRPYPWQVQNASQRLGAIGTLVVLVLLYLMIRYARRNRGQILAHTAPILYPCLFLLVTYALSVGNAGTGFRYRTHLVLLGLAVLVVLREHALRRVSEARDADSLRRVRAASSPLGKRTVGATDRPLLTRRGSGSEQPAERYPRLLEGAVALEAPRPRVLGRHPHGGVLVRVQSAQGLRIERAHADQAVDRGHQPVQHRR